MGFDAVINHQDFLLTINRNKENIVKDVLPGVHLNPLFLDTENGIWVLYGVFEPGVRLPRHFHTGTVHFYTTSGQWNYVEYPDQEQTAGSYLYEPGGSIHAFMVADDASEPAEGFMVVQGANINIDEDGNYLSTQDAGWIENAIIDACKSQDRPIPRYIKPAGGAQYSDAQKGA